MQPIHLAIGLVEGLITAAVLVFVYEARPEMLYQVQSEKKEKLSRKKTLAILTVCVVLIAGVLSLFASSHPDGLEWSIERITGSTEIDTAKDDVYSASEALQEKTAVLPDYAFKGSDSILGTSVSGVAGAAVVLVVCGGICWIFTQNKRKKMSV